MNHWYLIGVDYTRHFNFLRNALKRVEEKIIDSIDSWFNHTYTFNFNNSVGFTKAGNMLKYCLFSYWASIHKDKYNDTAVWRENKMKINQKNEMRGEKNTFVSVVDGCCTVNMSVNIPGEKKNGNRLIVRERVSERESEMKILCK